MSVNDIDAQLEAIKCSLANALPNRIVQRSLANPANADAGKLRAGLVCVVLEGGGNFANYLGREGDLGELQVSLVGFVLVDEGSQPEAIERAELSLLNDLLQWTAAPGSIDPADSVLPGDFTLSKQLEHPYGWVLLKLDVR